MEAADLKADRPKLGEEAAARIADRYFDRPGSAVELPSDRDRNFRITGIDGVRAVLKVAHASEDPAVLELENALLTRASEAGIPVPHLIGPHQALIEAEDGRQHLARLISWCEGETLATVQPVTEALLVDLGEVLGRLDRAAADIDHPAAHRDLEWDLVNAASLIEQASQVTDRPKLFDRWTTRLAPTIETLQGLPRQLIQNDANDYNVLVTSSLDGAHVSGLIDFGDCVHSARAAEPAIAIAYAMLRKRAPLRVAAALAHGYHREHPLEDDELGLLVELAALRLMQSVSSSAIRKAAEPDNPYLTITEAPALACLEHLLRVPASLGRAEVLAACGRLKTSIALPKLNWGKEVEHPFGSIDDFPETFDALEDRDEPHSMRLTTSMSGGAPFPAPWAGTLTGNGARAVLKAEGKPVLLLEGCIAGSKEVPEGRDLWGVRELGVFAEDLGLGLGLPKRARPDDVVWRTLALDSTAALGGESFQQATPSEHHRGRALSLSYSTPLTIVRGQGTTLFDDQARPFLDAVNNVPHVGHCHPRVVAALTEQAAILNTNTRYLHPLRERYLARLAGLFADPLELVYLVNSGSEANELALRLVEAATGGTEWIVVEAGYHGNTRRLIERSHYKFAGKGGFEPPDHIHVVPLPDPSFGRHRGEDTGERYAEYVREACEQILASGKRVAGILAEPLIGCGGQVVPPSGWLARAFDHVRNAGGLAIADEVQVGFGRVGTHWWAFDEQGATPDLVTLGKPIGGGHPLGAVVTSRAIAEAFDGGMEWFNTFGGNPVSCAVGMAVLDVIEDEGLRENARVVGEQLLAGFRDIESPWIREARGRGLYLGLDLRVPGTEEPATEVAAYVADRMKDRGVLISTDGPACNVLKIKPPVVFSTQDAQFLLEQLTETFAESPLRSPASP